MESVEQKKVAGFVVCVNNEGHEVGLELRGVYEVVADESLEPEDIRIIDESGEDYIYPAEYFEPAEATERPVDRSNVPPTDVEQGAREFMEENEALLEEEGIAALQRIIEQGVNLYTALSVETVEAANHAAEAARNLAEAIRNTSFPPRRVEELETEHARALEVYEHRNRVFEDFSSFMEQALSVYRQRTGESKTE